MATKDITDLQVLQAYADSHLQREQRKEGDRIVWPEQLLIQRTGQCQKVCLSAMERCYRRKYIECGVSLRSGWLTPSGEQLLASAGPDFEALRTERNRQMEELQARVADELGVPLSQARTTFNPQACYCACGQGGPCEHRWDGPYWTSDDRLFSSSTCSRCGHTAMSHDLRTAP